MADNLQRPNLGVPQKSNRTLFIVIGLLVAVGVGYFMFGAKTDLFKGSIRQMPQPEEEAELPTCDVDDLVCFEELVKEISAEAAELNKIVLKLNQEIDETQKKVKAQTAAIVKQEKVVKDAEAVLKKAKGKKKEQAEDKFEKAQDKLEDLRDDGQDLKEDLDEIEGEMRGLRLELSEFTRALESAQAGLKLASEQALPVSEESPEDQIDEDAAANEELFQ